MQDLVMYGYVIRQVVSSTLTRSPCILPPNNLSITTLLVGAMRRNPIWNGPIKMHNEWVIDRLVVLCVVAHVVDYGSWWMLGNAVAFVDVPTDKRLRLHPFKHIVSAGETSVDTSELRHSEVAVAHWRTMRHYDICVLRDRGESGIKPCVIIVKGPIA